MTKKIADKGASEAFLRANVGHAGDDCLDWRAEANSLRPDALAMRRKRERDRDRRKGKV